MDSTWIEKKPFMHSENSSLCRKGICQEKRSKNYFLWGKVVSLDILTAEIFVFCSGQKNLVSCFCAAATQDAQTFLAHMVLIFLKSS